MSRYFLKFWIPLAVASTIIMFALYVAVQQNIRTSANDPQIQMAEDAAVFLGNGFVPSLLIGTSRIDISKSLAPFVIIYDDTGKPISSSGYLNGQVPVLPAGVFEYARTHEQDRITWQPASSTRVAAIVVHFQGKSSGFIVAGRNLREVEIREGQLQLTVGAAWVAILILTSILVLYSLLLRRKELLTE